MKKEKNYETALIEITHLNQTDVIATSILSNDSEPTYDNGAWT